MHRGKKNLIFSICFLIAIFIFNSVWILYKEEMLHQNKIAISNDFFLFNYSKTIYASELEDAKTNYFKLEKLYIKWRDGLFGSRRYHKRTLVQYLASKIGSEIITDYNYIVSFLEVENKSKIQCNLIHQRWLRIRGKIEVESAKKFFKNYPELLNEWAKSGTLLSIYGKIRKFKLESDKRGYYVLLYLDNIHFFSSK